jgi:hypothetical protein
VGGARRRLIHHKFKKENSRGKEYCGQERNKKGSDAINLIAFCFFLKHGNVYLGLEFFDLVLELLERDFFCYLIHGSLSPLKFIVFKWRNFHSPKTF